MTPDRWIVLIGGLLLAAFIIRFFWLKRTKGVRASDTSSGHQEVMVLVKGGGIRPTQSLSGMTSPCGSIFGVRKPRRARRKSFFQTSIRVLIYPQAKPWPSNLFPIHRASLNLAAPWVCFAAS